MQNKFYCIINFMFYFDDINDKTILKTTVLNGLNHFFTTRECLIKTGDFKYIEDVNKNISEICDILSISEIDLISPIQTHSANIRIVEPNVYEYPDTDSLILNNPDQAIFLNFADCTPIILFDKVKNIAAVVHAGWRGTAQKIAPLTVKKMINELGCSTENIVAAIGPAISINCYDVGQDVYEKLQSTVSNTDGLFKKEDEKIYVELKGINKQQLIEIGIKEIEVSQYCTFGDNDMFFSYRRENGTTNRHSAVIKLNMLTL